MPKNNHIKICVRGIYMKKFVVFIIIIVIVAGGYFLFAVNAGETVEIKTATADYCNIENTIELTGQIIADKEVNISPPGGGIIKEIKVSSGQKVKKGDIIALLDDGGASGKLRQIEEQSAQVMESEAQSLQQAKAEQAKALILTQARTGSMELNAFNNSIKNAQSQALPDDALPAFSDSIEIQTLKQQAGASQIRAPMDGTVLDISRKAGETALPGVPILRIADINKLTIECSLNERDLNKLSNGMEVKLNSRQDSAVYTGSITDISSYALPVINYASAGINESKLIATITPDEGFTGIVGLYVDVEIPYEKCSAVLAVPIDCLTEKNTVFVLREDKIYEQQVEVGIMDYSYAQIISGLEFGDKVAVYSEELYNGAAVTVA